MWMLFSVPLTLVSRASSPDVLLSQVSVAGDHLGGGYGVGMADWLATRESTGGGG